MRIRVKKVEYENIDLTKEQCNDVMLERFRQLTGWKEGYAINKEHKVTHTYEVCGHNCYDTTDIIRDALKKDYEMNAVYQLLLGKIRDAS